MTVVKPAINLVTSDKVYAMSSRHEHRSTSYCSCSCGK